ncbi:amidase [Actinocorallia sp. A-T 12471]|uniref:amidase n=1 Tax=Actinocorallia sp. A-T 12471 TaxID=3089813 RepID=UPI0029CE3643|nr:amidase [Actinocorallia sp. A-T 12471]MDX6741369.1 amidase [Actinocorallia sp. A-T 12471]
MELWQLSATELAAGIRDREFSSVEAVRSFLGRIEAVNPALNALVEVLPDDALEAARHADQAVAAGAELGPLHGVPVNTKINTSERGKLASHGLTIAAQARATGDAACVAGLRASGAVFLGRSNAPAFSMRWFSSNDPHGRTLNPWDASRTPGGSSGGAAAAVAAGMAPIGQGNDIAGSIRFPAACCGVVGIRPTVGLVSGWEPPGGPELEGPLTFQTWAVHGPIAKTVADAGLALAAMAGPDLRDPFGIPALPSPLYAEGPVRIGVVRDVGLAKSHPSVEAALDLAARRLADAGHTVEEIDVPLLGEAARLWSLLLMEDLKPLAPGMREIGDEATRRNLAFGFEAAAELWGEVGVTDYIQGWARRATLITRLQELLTGGDRPTLLLTPVCAEPPFEQDADIIDPARARSLFSAMWPMTSVPVLGFPAITLPVTVTDGLPLSIQLIAPRFADPLLLTTAATLESSTPTLTPPLPS